MPDRLTEKSQGLLDSLAQLATLPLSEATAMPTEMYTSEEIRKLEQERIFSRQWLCAGRVNPLINAGDYLTYAICEQPVVVIRQEDGSIRAFANVCRHRLMQLVEGTGTCPNKRIVCPYHAWTYSIDGQCLGAPHMRERSGFSSAEYSLQAIRCEVWEGWIYVTLDPDIEPVASTLSELRNLVSDYNMADYVQIVQQDHVWDTNWKLLTENFMEGYHLPVAHRRTIGGYFPVKDTHFSPLPSNQAFTYQTFTKKATAPVGNAHPNNTKLKGKQRQTSILPTVFPSHMFALAPDHLWYLSLQPLGCDRVHIRYGAALAPEVLAASEDSDKLKKDVADLLVEVNAEDRAVVEGISKGIRAPLSIPGPLCWLEQENHEFTQYLARQLCG